MNPQQYEAWYESARGRWIGATEYAFLKAVLNPEPGASLLDVGCGTGYFTRLFAPDTEGTVIGVDPNREWLDYARTRSTKAEQYVSGRAEALPFPDRAFDFSVSVTALCFIKRQEDALREIVRVTRKRFVLGLLNRHSMLYRQKGRGGGAGAYRGAHWHTSAEIRRLLTDLPVTNIRLYSAVLLPDGTWMGRLLERIWPRRILLGGFLVVTADVIQGEGGRPDSP